MEQVNKVIKYKKLKEYKDDKFKLPDNWFVLSIIIGAVIGWISGFIMFVFNLNTPLGY